MSNSPCKTTISIADCADYWHLENFHPEGWITDLTGGGNNLQELLRSTGTVDFYQFVYPTCTQERWNAPEKKTPYNYKTLVGRVAPHLFNLYWDGTQVIQIHLKELKVNGKLVTRRMSVSEMNSYIRHEIERVHNIIGGKSEIIDRVFNISKWDIESDWIFPLNISLQDCETLLPAFTVYQDELFLICAAKGVRGNAKVAMFRTKVTYETKKPKEERMIDFFEQGSGKWYSTAELKDIMVTFGYTKSFRSLKRILEDNSFAVSRKKQGKSQGYTITSVRVEVTEIQDIDFQAVINSKEEVSYTKETKVEVLQ